MLKPNASHAARGSARRLQAVVRPCSSPNQTHFETATHRLGILPHGTPRHASDPSPSALALALTLALASTHTAVARTRVAWAAPPQRLTRTGEPDMRSRPFA
jgi:hypothetical protein